MSQQLFLVSVDSDHGLTEGDIAAGLVALEANVAVSEFVVRPLRLDFGAVAPVRLTRRQREVLELIAAGVPAGQMPERMGVALDTARHHRNGLLRRLGVGPHAVIARALQLGLLRVERETVA